MSKRKKADIESWLIVLAIFFVVNSFQNKYFWKILVIAFSCISIFLSDSLDTYAKIYNKKKVKINKQRLEKWQILLHQNT